MPKRSLWLCCGLLAALAGSGAAIVAGPSDDYVGPCALLASADGQTLYLAAAGTQELFALTLPAGKIARRLSLPGEPTGLALTPDKAQLVVTCAAPRSTVLIVDLRGWRAVARLPAGHTAMSPVVSPDGKRLYVCNRFQNDVSVFDLPQRRELRRVAVVREPIAAAVTPDGETLFVANHLPYSRSDDFYPLAADVTAIDAHSFKTAPIALPHGAHSLRGMCLSPDGRQVYVTHLISNFELVPSQVEMAWMTSNVVTLIDTREKKMLESIGLDELYKGAGNPWGLACTADGDFLCVCNAGSHELSVVATAAMRGPLVHLFTSSAVGSLSETKTGIPSLRHFGLPGKGPRAVALVGRKAYVAQYFSDSLAVVDLSAQPEAAVPTIALGPTLELSLRRQGELLFNDATLCYQNWQSCASCHPDGRSDVLNWDLMNDGIGNPKNTKSMLLAFQTPPSMAEGERATASDAVRSGIENILFNGRPEEEATAIDEYLRTLRPTPSPRLVDGKLSLAAQRGKRLFECRRVGCAVCHPGPLFTDLKMHNVDTQGPRDFVKEFDTPTLVEVWRTAPYLHDGRYLTIPELLTTGKHGQTRGHSLTLSAPELEDLTEYVLSL